MKVSLLGLVILLAIGSCKKDEDPIPVAPPAAPVGFQPASALGWVQGSPSNIANVDATWTLSTWADVVTQTIRYYTDAACVSSEGTSAVLSPVVSTHSFTGVDGVDVLYQIESEDSVRDTRISRCSPKMGIDSTAPIGASLLQWTQGVVTNNNSITTACTISPSMDVQYQVICYYADGICTVLIGSPKLFNETVNTDLMIGTHGTTYTSWLLSLILQEMQQHQHVHRQ